MAENLRKVVGEVLAEKENLSGVLINGDCAYNEGLKGDYQILAEILQPLIEAELPIHMTMGNHDDRVPFYEIFAKMKSEKPPVESKHVALVESKFVNFIFLDSLRFVNKVEGEFGQAQLDWLARALDAAPDKPALLIGHHYPQVFREDVIPADPPIKITGLVDSDPFLEMVAKRKHARAYIFGHSHKWSVATDERGFHQINLPPTAYVFNEKLPSGWVKATISPSGMKLALSALDKSHSDHNQITELKF